MSQIRRPKGTKDIYGQHQQIYQLIFNTFQTLAKSFNLEQISTPAFEDERLFNCAGAQSDIVSKQIYRFQDYNNRQLALKPEGTASIGRALVENKLLNNRRYQKLYYIDTMFRYEKPQKGRLRQFYQIGVELINDLSIYTSFDCIMLANTFLKKLAIDDYVIQINSLGYDQERNEYIKALTTYFKKHKDQLSMQSQARINTNPLRILDDKIDSELSVVKNAPKINQFWTDQTQQRFNDLLKLLDLVNLKYEINYQLVRGLDYYSDIVFEFVSNHRALGAKATLIGGGTYYQLNNNPDISGIGWGCGVERLLEILVANENQNYSQKPIDVIFLIEKPSQYATILPTIYQLRALDVRVDFNYQIKPFKKLYKNAGAFVPTLLVFQNLDQHETNHWTIKVTKQAKPIITTINQLIPTIEQLKKQIKY